MTTAFQAALVLAAAEGGKQTVAVAGSGAARFAAREVARGALWQVGSEAIEWLFSQFGWDWDPDGPDPYPPTVGGSCGGPWYVMCDDGGGSGFMLRTNQDGNTETSPTPLIPECRHINGWITKPDDLGRNDLYVDWTDIEGGSHTYEWHSSAPPGGNPVCVFLGTTTGCTGTPGPVGGPVTPPPQYITSGDCVYKVGLESLVVQDNGQPQGVLYKVEADDRVERSGPITNCNIAPTYVFEDGTGEGPVFIDPIGPDGEPLDIDEIVRRINNPIIKEINNNTDERIQEYFNERVPLIAGGTWDLQGVCETDAEGVLLDPHES